MEAIKKIPHSRRWLLIAAVLVVEVYVLCHLRIPLTRSLESLVFWWTPDTEHHRVISTGDYVTFDQKVPMVIGKVASIREFITSLFGHQTSEPANTIGLLKRVGCSPGENLSVDANGYYYCDGRYLAVAKREVAGKPITPFCFNGRIPAGMIFVIGDDARSYDSRVYGFISRDRITGVAWAIL
ncbi:hypothetical protein FO488_00300 [Geobacter sp. FeAm09]|uniref:S26 family signal peptidase n=1 Tax=Geobacter sp. FeAm09 TaxID=2597769 RepID=UPI0011F00E58|nr:S26 family signal peptidase [Geobacter sp. FeAm09]QEM66747.1 hypothetical protein FO488_00300 [Geobacter sp. FeAm09]